MLELYILTYVTSTPHNKHEMKALTEAMRASTTAPGNVAGKATQDVHVQAVCARSKEMLTAAARVVRDPPRLEA